MAFRTSRARRSRRRSALSRISPTRRLRVKQRVGGEAFVVPPTHDPIRRRIIGESMKIVSSSIEIAAPPEKMWRVLTDFASYPQWNPFIQSISGSLAIGERLRVCIKPPGGKAMTFRPTVLMVEDNRKLRWKGRLLFPGIFDGEHHFELVPTPSGSSFSQEEKFSGVLVRMMGAAIFQRTQRGFAEMNKALKQKAET